MRRSHRAGQPSTGSLSVALDKPLITALALLVGVYTIVTLATYSKVSKDEMSSTLSSVSNNNFATKENNNVNQQQQQRRVTAVETSPIYKLQHTFPIHVGDDTEVIPHPGLALVEEPKALGGGKGANKNKIDPNLPRTMTVPKFFDESHGLYYFNNEPGVNHTIRHYLGDGETLMTPERASQIGSFDKTGMETIYCSIASYRDPECRDTVEDLYARAEYPDRIRVAILDQRVDGDPVCAQPRVSCDQDPAQALCKYRHLIDVFEMDARLAVGPVFARHLAHRHYRGEYFAMQIDSHVRFIEHWDSIIQEQWKSANNEVAVLSTYLSDIIGSIEPKTHAGIHKGRPIMCASDYEGNGNYKHLRHGQQPEGPAGIHGQPTLHPFWAAGFSFARGHFVIQVPYDQHLPMVFQGEEISIGLRGFTYGYDYYAPEKSVCFHMYAIKENQAKRKKVPLFWENSNMYQGVGMRAMKRLNTIIGMTDYPTSEWKQDDIHKYGLGKVRRPDKFFKTFGIHTKEQAVEHHLCRFVGKPMMKKFMPALRKNRMGLDYDKIDYVFVDPAPDDKAPR